MAINKETIISDTGGKKIDNLIPYVLYDNASGTSTNFSTTENPNNFAYVDIISTDATTRMYKEQNHIIVCSFHYSDTIYSSSVYITRTSSGFNLSWNKSWYHNIVNNDSILVYKVIGYK